MSDKIFKSIPDGASRRDFLKATATVAGATSFLGTIGVSNLFAAAEKPQKASDKLPLKMAGYKVDRVEALTNGKVLVEGCDATFEFSAIGDMNTDVFSGGQTRDVTEIGLHPFMLAYANEGFRDYSLLPVFPLRTFRHKSIFIRTDRGINKPEDLRGKKIATPGFPLPH